ncbi:MAG: hypothetical protein A2017_15975 [Lentisphaerae bacterium GWF2_44_16]|nr:MAG: hypothetical protein A2017_15975 [Lentisphaerae bacterium GWF2_44_16]
MTNNPSQNKILIGKLRPDLKIFPGGTDASGHETWSVFDPVADRYSRIDADDYKLLSLLDREQSFETLLERIKNSGGNIDKENLIKSIYFLEGGNLLIKAYGADGRIAQNAENIKGKRLVNYLLSSYLFLNIPLLRPDPFFEKTAPLIRKIFNKWTMLAAGLLSLYGYISLLPQTERLGSIFWNSFHIQGMLEYVLAICVLKALHEAAHAYTAKLQGIRIRKMGVAFIVFFPRFYTDITDAWRLPDRKKRCLIDAAGILFEILIGGFAAIVWNNTPPGAVNNIAYSLFAVSVISTIFINGNPFIRYDGYFLLMDMVNIDNLYIRGNEAVKKFCREKFFGIKSSEKDSAQDLPGWRKRFVGVYSLLSFLYRIFLYTSIIMIVYLKFTKAIGMMLFALEAWLLIVKPITNEMRQLSKIRKTFNEKNIRMTSISAALLLAIFFIPLPWKIVLPCEILPAEHQLIYARTPGFLKALKVRDGSSVKKGDELFLLENPYLDWDGRNKKLDMMIQEICLDQVRSDRKQMDYAQFEFKRLELLSHSLSENTRLLSHLNIKATMDGMFTISDRHTHPGKWINEGELLGEVFSSGKRLVKAYASETDIARLKIGSRASVILDGTLKKYYGTLISVNPAPLKAISSENPLLDICGGNLQTMHSEDGTGLKFVFPIYLIYMETDKNSSPPPGRSGEAHIREYSSAGISIIKKIINVLRREIAF